MSLDKAIKHGKEHRKNYPEGNSLRVFREMIRDHQ